MAQEAADDNPLATEAGGRAQAMLEVRPRNQWMLAAMDGGPLEWSGG
ncbi:hypothetical protein DB30_07698 [Enhygromyxa salina]|uniref:Uncharacterized protein n=1 Tax=Enhygromyxa salina TaxID=215803 RepID=A0A0C2A5G3_9BACT|nr:hypothetical protein DB30_07698 [Enhygromyxa salina]